MDKHATGVVLQGPIEAFRLPITPHCVRFTLDSVNAVRLAEIVELPLEFCAVIAYYGVWFADLLYVDLECV